MAMKATLRFADAAEHTLVLTSLPKRRCQRLLSTGNIFMGKTFRAIAIFVLWAKQQIRWAHRVICQRGVHETIDVLTLLPDKRH